MAFLFRGPLPFYIIYWLMVSFIPLFGASVFETNDDISMRALADGTYLGFSTSQLVFSSPIWGKLLQTLYMASNQIDWYSTLFFIFISVSLFLIMHYMFIMYSNVWTRLLIFSSIILLFNYSIFYVNFTIVASISCLAALVLLQGYFQGEIKGSGWLLTAIVLLLTGASIRFSAFLLILILYFIGILTFRLKNYKLSYVYVALIAFTIGVFVFFINSLHYRYSSKEWQSYTNLLKEKRWFQDNQGLSYHPIPAGWNDCDVTSLQMFYYENHPKFSADSLKAIRSLYPAFEVVPGKLSSTFRDTLHGRGLIFTFTMILFLLVFSLQLEYRNRLRHFFFVLSSFLLMVLVALYIKMPFRVYFSIMATVWIFSLLEGRWRWKSFFGLPLKQVGCLVLMLLSFSIYVKDFYGNRKTYDRISNDMGKLEKSLAILPSDATIIGGEKYWSYLDYRLFIPAKEHDIYQRFYFQNWLIQMPLNEQKAVDIGLVSQKYEPAYYALINNHKAYILSDARKAEILKCYLQNTYGKPVQVLMRQCIENTSGFYQVTSP
ncbi:MAG: hypothetical protein SFW35_12505 [Chitinophagales bacterium]|nr:hypothetical protein [Chitinophagales bacterium]